MKALVVGDWHSDLHEQEVVRSLVRLGHQVLEFKWHPYFSIAPQHSSVSLGRLFRRAQNKYVMGPAIAQINRDLLHMALDVDPDLIFIYRGTHVTADTLRRLKVALPSCVLVGYNNDDPFSPNQPKYLWRHFLDSVPHYDLMLAYRHANLGALRQAGAKRVELLRSWYVPDRNHPVKLEGEYLSRFSTDVVFVGHFEPDQRLDCLEEIVRQGFRLRIFGPRKYWQKPLQSSDVLRHLAPVEMVWGEDYNRALCGAKVALCFFSKLNRDTYTRRCFEIPATQTLMLSEYSDDLSSLYTEGAEAEYFRDKKELLAKIRHYVQDDVSRARVARAGYNKVRDAGHDIDSRLKAMLAWVELIRSSGEQLIMSK